MLDKQDIIRNILKLPFICINIEWMDSNLKLRSVMVHDYREYKYYIKRIETIRSCNVPTPITRKIKFCRGKHHERIH